MYVHVIIGARKGVITMMQNTRNEILQYCMKKTKSFDFSDMNQFSANVLSNDLNISRSLASQYLNSFVKEGVLIKIVSRPVNFLYKKAIESQYRITIKDTVFDSFEEFVEALNEESCIQRNFMKLVGHAASLADVIAQLKSSLKYPHIGLPILIHGEKGVGKSLLCKEMLEYGKDAQILHTDAKLWKLKVFPEQKDVITQLIGKDSEKGLLEKSTGGILFIQEAQNLNYDDQMALAKVMELGSFHRSHSSQSIQVNTRIVLSTNESYEKYLTYDFLQCFPLKCHVPEFHKRFHDEREELLIHFFRQQELKLERRIMVSKMVIQILSGRRYPCNMDELKNVVEDICARVNHTSEVQGPLYVKVYQLPERILKDSNDDYYTEDAIDFIDVSAYQMVDEAEKVIALFNSILERLKKATSINEQHIGDCIAELTKFYNLLICDTSHTMNQSKDMENRISHILNKVLRSYNITIPLNCCSLFAFYLNLLKSSNSNMIKWKKEHIDDIQSCLKKVEDESFGCKLMGEKIKYAIQNNLEFTFDDMNKIILLINLMYFNNAVNKGKYLCLIIAHGYSTASSMANTVNTLLGMHVFEAFDMPLETSMLDVAERLKIFIDKYTIKDDILMLVDMGSLEKLDGHLKRIENKNIGIINNVSTRMALEVGNHVMNDYDMKTILQRAVDISLSNYTLVENKMMKDLVIFVSDNGIKMANRMKELFVNNLPKVIDVDFIAQDHINFMNEEYMNKLKKEYDILFVSGMCSSVEVTQTFISLEDIIFDIDIIKGYMNKYLSVEEMDVFAQNLIHSFSLENVVEVLSILDAKKLLGFVEETVAQMQNALQQRFYGSTTIGLYIHICCLIERLITKEPIMNREDLESFKEHHKGFIEVVKNCFEKMCQHYGVEICASEISYLYDYIYEDKGIDRRSKHEY